MVVLLLLGHRKSPDNRVDSLLRNIGLLLRNIGLLLLEVDLLLCSRMRLLFIISHVKV